MDAMRIPSIVLTVCTLAWMAAAPERLGAQAPTLAPGAVRQMGPVVPSFGGVFDVPDAVLLPPKDRDLKLRFDVNQGPEPGELNQHARAGVPNERLKAALVIHGTAGKDTLANDEYKKRFGKDNPNLKLLDELKAAGVQIYLCGQTAMSRNLPRKVVTPAVSFALAAMVAHMALERDGYLLNPF